MIPWYKCNFKILCTQLYNNGSGQYIYVSPHELFIQETWYENKKVVPYNDQSLQAEHVVRSLLKILAKHMTNLGQMWPKYLPLATFTYNTLNTPNIANYSPYELVFGRKSKLLLNLEAMPDIKILGPFKDY